MSYQCSQCGQWASCWSGVGKGIPANPSAEHWLLKAQEMQQRATKAEAERDAIYAFARLNGLTATAIDAAIRESKP